MVCLGNMFMDTLHKGDINDKGDDDDDDDDDGDDDNNNNNNNNNNRHGIYKLTSVSVRLECKS